MKKIACITISGEKIIGVTVYTNYRKADITENGDCVCANCRRPNDSSCPEIGKTRNYETTCSFFKYQTN